MYIIYVRLWVFSNYSWACWCLTSNISTYQTLQMRLELCQRLDNPSNSFLKIKTYYLICQLLIGLCWSICIYVITTSLSVLKLDVLIRCEFWYWRIAQVDPFFKNRKSDFIFIQKSTGSNKFIQYFSKLRFWKMLCYPPLKAWLQLN